MQRADKRLAEDGVEPSDLGVAHSMTGMDMDTDELRTAKPFDSAFIRMLTPHHEGAIIMARAELARGHEAELRALADSIIGAQQREIGRMRSFARHR